MTIKDYSERIGNLIGKDGLKGAIRELNQLLKDSPQLNEAIVQSEASISIRNSENVVAGSDIQAGGDVIIGGSKKQNKAG